MAKKKGIPTDPEELREMLKKLKDKESRLEADLAIKEHPELEQGITCLILAMVDVKKVDQQLRVTKRPASGNEAQVAALTKQIAFYKNKMEAAQATLDELTGGSGKKLTTLNTKQCEALGELRKQYDEWADAFGDAGVDMFDMIPSLQDYVKRADAAASD